VMMRAMFCKSVFISKVLGDVKKAAEELNANKIRKQCNSLAVITILI